MLIERSQILVTGGGGVRGARPGCAGGAPVGFVVRVLSSSAPSAYGPTAAVPISEDHPLRPNAFYPATKAAAEMLLRGLAGAYGYSFAILRYMNVYGTGP